MQFIFLWNYWILYKTEHKLKLHIFSSVWAVRPYQTKAVPVKSMHLSTKHQTYLNRLRTSYFHSKPLINLTIYKNPNPT